MKRGFILSVLSLCSFMHMTNAQEDYKKIHEELIVVDGHNDVIVSSILRGRDIGTRLTQGHTDIPRLKEGGVDVQVFAVWSDDTRWKTNAFRSEERRVGKEGGSRGSPSR